MAVVVVAVEMVDFAESALVPPSTLAVDCSPFLGCLPARSSYGEGASAGGISSGDQGEVGVAFCVPEGVGLDSVENAAVEIGALGERAEQAGVDEGAEHGEELQMVLVHLARMELDYQIVAGMGMDLLVEADSDAAVEVVRSQGEGM